MESGYALVNGINLYYEVRGTGQPTILLHGGLGATLMFGPNLDLLAAGRKVIAVDLQGHGRTPDIDRPMSLEAMADDIAALIQYFGFLQADLVGYSMGAGVALQTAIRHPQLVRKLVLVSFPYKQAGWYPEIVAGMASVGADVADVMKHTPMYATYANLAPRVDDWPVLLTKMGHMLGRPYDWTEAVAALDVSMLIVVGDADAVRTAHAVEFFELRGGGQQDGGWDGSGLSNAQLAILPGATHYSIFSSPALSAVAIPFLDAPLRTVGPHDMTVTRVFDAPVDRVWHAWTDSEWLKRWWGPTGFTCPVANLDVREGGTSLVCMRAPAEYGGHDLYNTWTYHKLEPHQRIEFIQRFADAQGNLLSPADLGLPAGVPAEVPHVLTFNMLGDDRTELTITEYGYPTIEIAGFSRMGMEQCLDKLATIL